MAIEENSLTYLDSIAFNDFVNEIHLWACENFSMQSTPTAPAIDAVEPTKQWTQNERH